MRPILFVIVCVACALGCKREADQPVREAAKEEKKAEQRAEERKEPLRDEIREVERVSGAEATIDAIVLSKLIASNQHEVMVGQKVLNKTARPEVKRFAEMLVKDHGGALRKMQNLRIKHKIDTLDDDSVRKLREESEEKIEKLDGKSGDDLDRTFLEMAIDDHEATLDKIDKEFLPNLRDGQIKTLVTRMRPTVQHHLEEAHRILDSIKR